MNLICVLCIVICVSRTQTRLLGCLIDQARRLLFAQLFLVGLFDDYDFQYIFWHAYAMRSVWSMMMIITVVVGTTSVWMEMKMYFDNTLLVYGSTICTKMPWYSATLYPCILRQRLTHEVSVLSCSLFPFIHHSLMLISHLTVPSFIQSLPFLFSQ